MEKEGGQSWDKAVLNAWVGWHPSSLTPRLAGSLFQVRRKCLRKSEDYGEENESRGREERVSASLRAPDPAAPHGREIASTSSGAQGNPWSLQTGSEGRSLMLRLSV